MSYIFSKNKELITFLVAVFLSVFLVAIYAFGASLVDTDSVGVGTTTVGSGLYVEEGLSSILSNDAYIYGQLNVPYIVSTSTTASTFAGQVTTSGTAGVGVGTATPGASQFGVNEGWTSVLSGNAYIYGQLTLPYLVSTTTTDSSFAGSLGVGTTTPGSAGGVRLGILDDVDVAGIIRIEDHLRTSYLVSTSTTASTFAGPVTTSGTSGIGVGSSTVGASAFEVNEGWSSLLSGDVHVYGQLNVPYIVSTSTTASTFAGQVTTSGTAGVGVGTATPGASQFGVNEGWTSVLSGDVYVYGQFNVPNVVATSTTATSTIGYGLGVDTNTLIVDASSNKIAIATSTFPSVNDETMTITAGSASASTTMYLGGTAAMIILRAVDGQDCIAISGAQAGGAIDTGVTLTAEIITCPAD